MTTTTVTTGTPPPRANLGRVGTMSMPNRIALGAAGVAAAAAAVQVGGTDAGPELCVIRGWTGGWCPGCGGARAAHHLLHGELGAAWVDHPWVVAAAVQLTLMIGVAVVALVLGRRGRGAHRPRWLFRALVLANAGALVAVWLVRVGTGAIPSPV